MCQAHEFLDVVILGITSASQGFSFHQQLLYRFYFHTLSSCLTHSLSGCWLSVLHCFWPWGRNIELEKNTPCAQKADPFYLTGLNIPTGVPAKGHFSP